MSRRSFAWRTYDPGVIPLVLAGAGALALGIAAAILRSFGPRYRVGRLLAAAPRVSVAEAVRLAEAGETAYVRVDGRIDSADEFEDADHRPLVLRRTRIEWHPAAGAGGHAGNDLRWRPVGEPEVELAPFVVREGLDEIDVDGEALGDGLVVVPRISVGVVGDLGDRAPADVAADGDARLIVEQVSSVEHATVAGVPRRAPDGRVIIGAGLGRPLLLTTLEQDEAMRVLTGGATSRARLVIACLVAGAVLLGVAALWFFADAFLGGASVALAASPDPTLRPGGDTRTPGSNPGFVGEPLLAILGVLALGVGSVLGTLAYVRLSGGRRPAPPRAPRGRCPGRARGDPRGTVARNPLLVLSRHWKEMWGRSVSRSELHESCREPHCRRLICSIRAHSTRP